MTAVSPALGAATQRTASALPPSWQPQNLEVALADGYQAPEPTVGRRTDGKALLYRGKINSVASEPEAGKTWLALTIAQQELELGHTVVYVDYEDDAGSIVGRLRTLGVAKDRIQSRFHYIHPHEELGDPGAVQALVAELDPTLVVIDGITEAMTTEGLDLVSNQDVAEFFHRVPDPIATCGPAVLLVDHEVKRERDRGRYALGAQHKLAAVSGAAFKLKSVTPFSVAGTGSSDLVVVKDRPGRVRSSVLDDDQLVGSLVLASHQERVSAIITSDSLTNARPDPRTLIQTRIREFLTNREEGVDRKGDIKEHVKGAAQAITDALNAMIEAGEVTASKPYRLTGSRSTANDSHLPDRS